MTVIYLTRATNQFEFVALDSSITKWHKVAAMIRFVAHFGAYLSHLCSLTEDSSVTSADKHKLKGYILKWQNKKMLLACALFTDFLKPVVIPSKSLRYTCTLRTKNAIY